MTQDTEKNHIRRSTAKYCISCAVKNNVNGGLRLLTLNPSCLFLAKRYINVCNYWISDITRDLGDLTVREISDMVVVKSFGK